MAEPWDTLRALFPDNVTGDIGADDMRTQVDLLEIEDGENVKDAELTDGSITDIKIGGTAGKDSVATKEYVDTGGGDLTLITFAPQDPAPAHTEGGLFYDDESKALGFYSDVTTQTLNIGQEQMVRVVNKTGVTITNGKAVRYVNFDPITGVPEVVLAQADTVSNSIVAGIATHDIPTGTEGWIVYAGMVRDIDTSAWAVGTRVYLSDTIAGAFTDDAPENVSYIGIIAKSDASTGQILTRTLNLVALPSSLAVLRSENMADTIGAVFSIIDNYDAGDAIGELVYNISTGQIILPRDGWFRVTVNMTLDALATTTTARNAVLRILNQTGGNFYDIAIQLPRDQQFATISAAVPLQGITGETVVLQIRSDDLTTVEYTAISFDIESINMR